MGKIFVKTRKTSFLDLFWTFWPFWLMIKHPEKKQICSAISNRCDQVRLGMPKVMPNGMPKSCFFTCVRACINTFI